MTLKVVRAAAVAANTPFTFTVPAQEVWKLQSVCATLSRAVGGTPNRALKLSVSDGTSTLMGSPAADAGTEPGTLTVTWAAATPAASSSGSTGTSMGPIPVIPCLPGYIITGTVLNGVVTDQWTVAVAWVDFTPT